MSQTKTAFVSTPGEHAATFKSRDASGIAYNVALGYLRAFVVVLVIAHHAVLAYHSFAPPPPTSLTAQPRWWQAFPVVDSQRWTGFTLLVGFNDVFFMSLMFFLSGLFVWNSLQRKGTVEFLRTRLLRLGLPFVLAAAFVAPIAYYPAYLQTTAHPSFAGFRHEWLSLGQWPAGPAWFVWVLLAFDCFAALLFMFLPRLGQVLGRLIPDASRRPLAFFGLLIAVSSAAYIPMALAFNPLRWTAFGPFVFQTSRIFHYLVYFLIAVGLGAWGIQKGLLAPDGKLARRWPIWGISALLAYALAVVVTIVTTTSRAGSLLWETIGSFSFVLSCAASSFAFLAIFVRFARSRLKLFDSLRDNSYGMYLIHYAFVSWLQYALLRAPLSAITKGSIVFIGALTLSWAAISAMRRVRVAARVI